jgi:hypothetical protein
LSTIGYVLAGSVLSVILGALLTWCTLAIYELVRAYRKPDDGTVNKFITVEQLNDFSGVEE